MSGLSRVEADYEMEMSSTPTHTNFLNMVKICRSVQVRGEDEMRIKTTNIGGLFVDPKRSPG
jgi:hypothetical protein